MKENLQNPFVDKMDIRVIFLWIFKKKSTKSTKLSTFTPLSFYHKPSVSSTILGLVKNYFLTSPYYSHESQNRSTRFATGSTVTISKRSHSLGKSLR